MGEIISMNNRVCGFVTFLSLLVAYFFLSLIPKVTNTSISTEVARVPRGDDFQLALEESLGFFADTPAHEWQRMKNITRGRVYHSRPLGKADKPTVYFASNWDPDFSCRFEESIGQTLSDGHKWVCDPHRLEVKEDCLVFSIGSNGNFAFEMDIQSHLPNYEIHTFDFTDYSKGMWENGLNGTNFHAWGLQSSSLKKPETGPRFESLQETMELLGLSGRRIDIFKIDCEGCELTLHKDLLSQDIRQILVEVHGLNENTEPFFKDIHDAGYVMFHKEPNLYTEGKCIEIAYLKLAKEYFL